MKPSRMFRNWLQQQVDSGHEGTRLPTYAALSAQWNISQSTVRSVVGGFREAGKLYSIPGRGTFLGSLPRASGESTDDIRPLSSRESITDAFKRAVQRGDFRRGMQLPPVKQVCCQFKVKPQTVTRALRALVRLGYAEQIGKRYWVGDLRSLVNINARKEVVFFCDTPDSFTAIFEESLVWRDVFTEMNYELTECNVQLRLESADRLTRQVGTWCRSMRFPLGIIHANLDKSRARTVFPALRRLVDKAGPERPAIIATVNAGAAFPDSIPRFSTFIHHGNENTMVARTAAGFCRAERFRRIGYFCDDIMHCREALRFLTELHHVDPSESMCILVKLPEAIATVDELLEAMARRLWSSAYLGRLLDKYGELDIAAFGERIRFVDDFEPVFRNSPRGSMWLFMNEDSAVGALHWCKAAGRSLASDISILGFGSAATYLHHGISSCGVDNRQLGYRIAHAVMGTLPVQKTRRGFFRTTARLFERRTARWSRA